MAKLGIVSYLKASHGSKVHEHNFRIEVTLIGNIINDFVGGLDFHDVKKIIDEELSKLEGKYLPDHLNMKGSVENLGEYLLNGLKYRGINSLYSIKIYEEPDRFVEIYFEELDGHKGPKIIPL